MKNNVVSFPGMTRRTLPSTPEELKDRVEETRKQHVEFMLEDMLPQILIWMEMEGYNVRDQENTNEIIFMVENLRSLMFKSLKYEHPLQKAAASYVESLANKVVDTPE